MPNFDFLIQAWPSLGPVLPWVSGLILVGTIIVTLLRVRRGWQWLQVQISKFKGRMASWRESFWHQLGIATLQDLSSSKVFQPKGQLVIARHGLLWTLTAEFWESASKNDELDIDFQLLQTMIQGPFCLQCGTRLFDKTSDPQISGGIVIATKCPRVGCSRTWTKRKENPAFESLKRSLLGRLLAELRMHHKISPEQEPPLRKRRAK